MIKFGSKILKISLKYDKIMGNKDKYKNEMSMRITKENLENFEVKIGISDYPDLKVKFFILPEQFIFQEFLKIKDDLKIRKYAYFDKKAEKDLLILELFFFFQKEIPLKNPKELVYFSRPDRWIKRYYSEEIEDSLFKVLKQIDKKKIIDKAAVISEGWRNQTAPEIIKLIDELEIKNLRRNSLTREEVKKGFNKKIRTTLIKLLKEFVEEVNSPEMNKKINEEYPDSLEKRRILYQELCNKIWQKYYQRIHRKKLSQYLFFIKQEAERVFIKYYTKIVKNFLLAIKNQLNNKELKIFKMYYLPLDILGNKTLHLHHNKYFNPKDFDKNVMPLLIASKVFNIRKVKKREMEGLIERTLKALLTIRYWHKFLIREDEMQIGPDLFFREI